MLQEKAEAYLILSDLKKKEFDEGLYGKEGFKADSEPGMKIGGRQGRTTEQFILFIISNIIEYIVYLAFCYC